MEVRLSESMPHWISLCTIEDLGDLLVSHAHQTRNQIAEIAAIFKRYGESPGNAKSQAVAGLTTVRFMALVFECIQTDGIAQLSYLVGDDSSGVAAVVDPRADVDCYLELARAKQVSITHIFETHIHADFVSGACELGARVESARIFLSHEGGARYD